MDKNDPENYGFRARMRHPDGEIYGCLFKGTKDIVEAAKGYAREEEEHGVQCVRISRWERWQGGEDEDAIEQVAALVGFQLDRFDPDSYAKLIAAVCDTLGKQTGRSPGPAGTFPSLVSCTYRLEGDLFDVEFDNGLKGQILASAVSEGRQVMKCIVHDDALVEVFYEGDETSWHTDNWLRIVVVNKLWAPEAPTN